MNLLIHDLTAAEWGLVADQYQGWNVISDTGNIRPCIGCFRCWTGGSGTCVFQDGYHRMCDLIHEAEEMVVMSKYTYGGFSSFVKSVFDRCIGYVLPEFETAYGEMHHQKRFAEDKPVTFIFRGANLSEEAKNKAREYVAAVCRNLRGHVKEVLFQECTAEETRIMPDEKAERSGVLMINCSLRGKGSHTGVFLKRVQERVGTHVDAVSLMLGKQLDQIAEAISKAETVVFGAPLYVDGLPASALKLMEKIKTLGTGNGCRLYAVVDNGLYESRQNVNMLSMVKDFCAENGFLYRGAAAIGASELVGTLMRSGEHSPWPTRNAKRCLDRLAEAIKTGNKIDDIYADPFLFPRWLYILIANTNWQKLKKKDKQHFEEK